jgi:Leucine-rich repeat (LRR) protein
MNKNNQIYFMNIVKQSVIPGAISYLNHLRDLNIGSTHSYRLNGQLSTKIEHLPLSLIYLKISDTKITQWPDNFNELTRLQTLGLSNIGLITPRDANVHVTSLAVIYSPYNSLTILSPAIAKLRSLTHIIITNNPGLRSIQVLNGLPSLQRLDVKCCSIERLPLNLPNLTDLYMTNNSLTSLIGIQT